MQRPDQSSTLTSVINPQREIFIRFSLIFFCLMLWFKDLNYLAFPVLILAWLLDIDRQKLKRLIQEPLIQAILFLCSTLVLGLIWSEASGDGRLKWIKYFALLIYIPFFSLLNQKRLPSVFMTLIAGYICVVSLGIYEWLIANAQGVPLLKISYLGFSAILGIGIIMAVYFAGTVRTIYVQLSFWLTALGLLFVQFNQSGRGLLIATLAAVIMLVFLQYRIKIKQLLLLMSMTILVCTIFAINSANFQDRYTQFIQDFSQLQQGNYETSIGYRLAIWDVGLDGISKRPLLGYGTGTPTGYFEQTIPTYKNGIYKDLPTFQNTSHFHNDWIELGMHLGALGILAFAFLLWRWHRTFSQHQLPILGTVLIVFIFSAGLTDTLMLYNRIPVLLLTITALITCWQDRKATT